MNSTSRLPGLPPQLSAGFLVTPATVKGGLSVPVTHTSCLSLLFYFLVPLVYTFCWLHHDKKKETTNLLCQEILFRRGRILHPLVRCLKCLYRRHAILLSTRYIYTYVCRRVCWSARGRYGTHEIINSSSTFHETLKTGCGG